MTYDDNNDETELQVYSDLERLRNSYAELLAAANDAIIFLTRGDRAQPCPIVLAKLRAAIAKAEQAP